MQCDTLPEVRALLKRVMADARTRASEAHAEARSAIETKRAEIRALADQKRIAWAKGQRQFENAKAQFEHRYRKTLDEILRQRHAELGALEVCPAAPFGLLRVLRAELEPACAQRLLGAWALAPPADLDEEGSSAIRGLLVSTQLAALKFEAPKHRGALEPEALVRFVNEEIVPWQTKELDRLQHYAAAVNSLPRASYGGVLARIALSLSSYRLFHAHRATKTPNRLRKEYELRVTFYGALDEVAAQVHQLALEQRRSALAAAELLGLIDHPQLTAVLRSETELVTHPLPRLLIELPEPPSETNDVQWLARNLPPFYVEQLTEPQLLATDDRLEALAVRGLPVSLRRYLKENPEQPPSDPHRRRLLAAARVRLGLIYGSSLQFAWARALSPTAGHPPSVTQALAEVFREAVPTSPQNAADLDVLVAIENSGKSRPFTKALAAYNRLQLEMSVASPDELAKLLGPLHDATMRLRQMGYPLCVESRFWREESHEFLGEKPPHCHDAATPFHWLGSWDGFSWKPPQPSATR